MTDAGCNVPYDGDDDDDHHHQVDDDDDGGDDDQVDDYDDGDGDSGDDDAFACTYVADFPVLSFAFSVDTTERTNTEIS